MERVSGKMIYRPSWKNYILNYVLVFVLLVLVFVIGMSDFGSFWKNVFYVLCMVGIVVIAFKILLDKFDERLTVSENEVSMENGLFSRTSTEIGILQIRTISVHQKLVQRLLNIGDIYIASAGTEGYEIIAHGISSPNEIRDHIQAYMRSPSVKPESEKSVAE